MDILVGYTGFVGSNLKSQHRFDAMYNSKNIEQAFGLNPDLCVYSGVPAEKFLANKDPDGDMAVIQNAINNIEKINPKHLVLISTVDVFVDPNGANEDSDVNTDNLHAYGYDRHCLEQWCLQNIGNCNVIRLPGLFGKNIKKNFIYDMINFLPSVLNELKFFELSAKEPLISRHYIRQQNGFYKCSYQTPKERQDLIAAFKRLDFSALHFTDSRASFQFYNLAYIWQHTEIAIKRNLQILHLAVPPVCVNEIYRSVYGCDFVNQIIQNPPRYDFKTKYDELFGGAYGYLFCKEKVIGDIVSFVKGAAL